METVGDTTLQFAGDRWAERYSDVGAIAPIDPHPGKLKAQDALINKTMSI